MTLCNVYFTLLPISFVACAPRGDGEMLSAESGFVGNAQCMSCHTAEADLWAGSHHDLAMQGATAETVLGDFGGARFEGSSSVWTLLRDGPAFVARAEGPGGAAGEYRVAYTFGAVPLQQYLVEFPGGRYQVLPVAWDSRPVDQGGQRWFEVEPGESDVPVATGPAPAVRDVRHWSGRDFNWNSMCADCHSTGLRKNYSAASDRYATEWAEPDVGCEACHGPGSGHVAWAEALDSGSFVPAASLEGADLGLVVRFDAHDPGAWLRDPQTGTARPLAGPASDGQVDTCGRCHARRSAITARYRHGQTLLDSHQPALLEEGLYFADGQIRGEVYVWGSFVQSAMYRAGVTCNDCHDAHSLRVRGEGNAVCATCHTPSRFDTPDHHFHESGTRASLCVSCHMAARTYMGVDPRRDHSFRVPDAETSRDIGAADPCTTCHSEMTGAEAAATIAERRDGAPTRRTRYHALALDAARRGDPESRPGLYALLRDPGAPAITRATALTLLGSDPAPERVAAVRRGLQDPDPIVRLGAVRGVGLSPTRQLLDMSVPLLQDPVRAVRLAAAEAVAPFAIQPDGGNGTGQPRPRSAPAPPTAVPLPPPLQPALRQALAEYREAQLANAERPEAQLNLAWLAVLEDDRNRAETALEKAIALDPAFVPAYVNLADLYRRADRDPEGEPLLRSALDQSPRSADAHHALGLLLVRLGRSGEAMASLRRAAEHEARGTRYAYTYAVALRSAGDTAAARDVLEQALNRHPRDRDILVALAVLHRDAGRTGEALRYARALAEAHPRDPAGPALISELSR